MLTYLRIEGAPEYWDIMDKNLSAAMAGQKTAQQALDDTAAAWEQITDRLGRDKILKQYQEAIGYEGLSGARRPGRPMSQGGPGPPGSGSMIRWTSRIKFLFLLPAMLWVLAFTVFPLGYSLVPGLPRCRTQGRGRRARGGADARRRRQYRAEEGRHAAHQDGRAPRTSDHVHMDNLANFARAFGDEEVHKAVQVTAIFVIAAVATEIALGLGLAWLFNQHIFGRPVLRSIMILPIFATPIAVGYLFFTIFYEIGGPLEFLGIPWLSNPHWALVSVILVDIWQWTPFCFLVFLAALQGIPDELIESALLETSSQWTCGGMWFCRCCCR